ncbi:MAG: DNA-directed DNA polymerase [Caeruleum heppii]|nr:MAG: DNA-directed DNA polymerase [Caeruleum heppii]
MPADSYNAIRHHFDRLASDEDAVRLASSYGILAGLSSCPPDALQKILDRLLKGLASGPPDFGQLLDLLKNRTRAEGNVSGQEARDHRLGRLFGLEAIVKSEIVFQPGCCEERWKPVVDLLLDLGTEKTWLREECGWIIYEALRKNGSTDETRIHAESAVERLCEKQVAMTPEGVAIWLKVHELYPDIRLPKRPWRHRDPLEARNLDELARVLKEASAEEFPSSKSDGKDQQRGMWTPKLHFAWGVILERLYTTDKSLLDFAPKKGALTLTRFWQHVVDDTLFAASASQERKHWGFLLSAKVIHDAPKQWVTVVFSRNMIRCLINHLSDGERYLHRISLRSLKALHIRIELDPDLAHAAVVALTRKPGTPNFDHVTKTKTVASLFHQASDDALLDIVRDYERTIRRPDEDDPKKAEDSDAQHSAVQDQAFILLYSLVLFQLYNGDEDALSVLSDLDACFAGIRAGKNGNNTHDSDILIEVLLSLISRKSTLLRRLSEQVFGIFAGDMTNSSVQLLLDVLASEESIAGQQTMFEQEDGDASDDTSSNDAQMVDSGAISATGDLSNPKKRKLNLAPDGKDEVSVTSGSDRDTPTESGSTSGSEMAGSGMDMDQGSDETARLNAALAQIVGTRPFDEKADASISDEELMNDDEMFALDDQMVSVFKERKKSTNKKEEKRDAKETMINFKNRVLDLLEIFVKQQHRNPLALEMIAPLLTLGRTSRSKQLADRACSIIRTFAQKCRGKEIPPVEDDERVWPVLHAVHREAKQGSSKVHATACSQASLAIVKILVDSDKTHVVGVASLYAATQIEWLQGSCRLQPAFFSDFLNWSTSYTKQNR